MPGPGPLRRLVMSRRNLDILTRNRLTLAILVGSPVMVLLMFAVLFQPGAFDVTDPSPNATVMILFWIAFGGFFFGLTYGLLQICAEFAILRRERLAGLRLGPYLVGKVTVLLPLLAAVDALMLGVLRALDRLPQADAATYGRLFGTLLLSSAAALALGLLTSAARRQPRPVRAAGRHRGTARHRTHVRGHRLGPDPRALRRTAEGLAVTGGRAQPYGGGRDGRRAGDRTGRGGRPRTRPAARRIPT